MTLSETYWAEYEWARQVEEQDGPQFGVFLGNLWDRWFAQACKEGRDPSRLARDSLNLDEKIAARSIPCLGGCLFWDGGFDVRGKPVVQHGLTPAGYPKRVYVQVYILRRESRYQPRHRLHTTCGHGSCVQPLHLVQEQEPYSRRIPDERIYAHLQVLALRLGRSPYGADWRRAKFRPSVESLRYRFGTWGALLKRAGLGSPPPSGAYGPRADADEMLLLLRRFIDEHGVPTEKLWHERKLAHARSAATYGRRFGSWGLAIQKALQ